MSDDALHYRSAGVDLRASDDAKSRMLDWMKSYDVFICPTSGQPAQPIDAQGEGGRGGGGTPSGFPSTASFNCTGWPVVVVRCGSSADGKLPIGLQVVCAPWREDICIAVAAYLAQLPAPGKNVKPESTR